MYFQASDSAHIAYWEAGDGTPLICLHGISRNSKDFAVLPPLLPGVRIIAMDFRGRGDSEWTGASTYTLAREAEDVSNLLDHLELPAALFLGASRGGIVAMRVAADHPERVLGLCLNDIGPEMEPEGRARIPTFLGVTPSERTIAERVAAMPTRMTEFADVPAEKWRTEVENHFVETEEGLRFTYDPELRDAFMATVDRAPNLWHGFKALQGKPVAVIRGANSPYLSPRIVAEMRALRPDLITAEVPGRGHMPFLDEPESVAALRVFLRQAA
jgi:pimeloyl-ACP methyl ester carboxylesterase